MVGVTFCWLDSVATRARLQVTLDSLHSGIIRTGVPAACLRQVAYSTISQPAKGLYPFTRTSKLYCARSHTDQQ